jgi:hypothetical protein
MTKKYYKIDPSKKFSIVASMGIVDFEHTSNQYKGGFIDDDMAYIRCHVGVSFIMIGCVMCQVDT